jgi:hypothetical protein
MRRDIGNIQNALVHGGGARWLAPAMIDSAAAALKAVTVAPSSFQESGAVARNELKRAAQAVRRLVTAR